MRQEAQDEYIYKNKWIVEGRANCNKFSFFAVFQDTMKSRIMTKAAVLFLVSWLIKQMASYSKIKILVFYFPGFITQHKKIAKFCL